MREIKLHRSVWRRTVGLKEHVYSVLLVSASEKFNDALTRLLPASKYDPVTVVHGAAAARTTLIDLDYDLIIINSPLPDDNGTRLAVDISIDSKRSVVLLAVRSEYYAEAYDRVLEHGVFVISRPMTEAMLRTALDWMKCERERLRGAEKKAVSLEEKMEEIRLVNRAKWILISELKMGENEAHRYIEKHAMDLCIPKKEVAQDIIRRYT